MACPVSAYAPIAIEQPQIKVAIIGAIQPTRRKRLPDASLWCAISMLVPIKAIIVTYRQCYLSSHSPMR